MGITEYKKLIEDFCAAAAIREVETLLHGGHLMVDGMLVQLAYVEASGQCRIAIDLGPIPEALQGQCHRLMLGWNHEQGADGQQVMSIDPISGRARLAVYLSLDSLADGAGLLDLFELRLEPLQQSWESLLAELAAAPQSGSARPALDNFA